MDNCKKLKESILLINYTDYFLNKEQFVNAVDQAGYAIKRFYKIKEETGISMFLKFQMLKFLNQNELCIINPDDVFIYIINYNHQSEINILTDPELLLNHIHKCSRDTSRYVMVFVKLEPFDSDEIHANTIVIDTISTPMKAWRLEPNFKDEWVRVRNKLFKRGTHELKENIKDQLNESEQRAMIYSYTEYVNGILKGYFSNIGINYLNEFPETCGIDHGGICAYISVIQFFEGKNLTFPVIKNYILNYFMWEYTNLCGKTLIFDKDNDIQEIINFMNPIKGAIEDNKLTLTKNKPMVQLIDGKFIWTDDFVYYI